MFAGERRPWHLYVAAKVVPSRFQNLYRRRSFETIYRDRLWGAEEGALYYSGEGSRGEVVSAYVRKLSGIIADMQRTWGPVKVVDLGCGDFEVGRELLRRTEQMTYVGCDIVPGLIAHHKATVNDPRARFEVVDVVTDAVPEGDVCLVRQVLQHLSNDDVLRVLPKLVGYGQLYVTESQPKIVEGPPNPDKAVGSGIRFNHLTGRGRGLELNEQPFNRRVDEVLRVESGPGEDLVTYRVHPEPVASGPSVPEGPCG